MTKEWRDTEIDVGNDPPKADLRRETAGYWPEFIPMKIEAGMIQRMSEMAQIEQAQGGLYDI